MFQLLLKASPFPPTLLQIIENPYQHDFVLGVARVNCQSQQLWTT